MSDEHIHFVTGRLADCSLRTMLAELAPKAGFTYTVDVLPISVAALMRAGWIARKIKVPPETSRVMVPGHSPGDLSVVEQAAGVEVVRGPKDLRQLPEFFGQKKSPGDGRWDIEIIAEINHCPRLTVEEILRQAEELSSQGADVIDLGCNPDETWDGVADCVFALRDAGYRVSIDSFNPVEVERAICAGAELVLSVNSSNRERARDWDAELVVVPDDPDTLTGLDQTIEVLTSAGRRIRIDPVLTPLGLGFAHSLGRYLEVRRRYPDAAMLMGIGNLTEMTDADSASVNVLLLGFCQEIGIHSVLTTQVINWARSSVRECDLARRLVYQAVHQRTTPKHMEPKLITLRDERLYETAEGVLDQLSQDIKDKNYRIFAEDGVLHLVSAGLHLVDQDPYALFGKLLETGPDNVDDTHAFYLGFELAKAYTALQLAKNYRQDQPLDWGYLTVQEDFKRLRKRKKTASHRRDEANPEAET